MAHELIIMVKKTTLQQPQAWFGEENRKGDSQLHAAFGGEHHCYIGYYIDPIYIPREPIFMYLHLLL